MILCFFCVILKAHSIAWAVLMLCACFALLPGLHQGRARGNRHSRPGRHRSYQVGADSGHGEGGFGGEARPAAQASQAAEAAQAGLTAAAARGAETGTAVGSAAARQRSYMTLMLPSAPAGLADQVLDLRRFCYCHCSIACYPIILLYFVYR
jgi:hypothetical protein